MTGDWEEQALGQLLHVTSHEHMTALGLRLANSGAELGLSEGVVKGASTEPVDPDPCWHTDATPQATVTRVIAFVGAHRGRRASNSRF